MAKQQVSREALRAMVRLSGLELTDEQLDELLPQVRRTVQEMAGLDVLDLEDVEPALAFKADVE